MGIPRVFWWVSICKCRAVIERRGPGISPGYYEHSPQLLLKENKRKMEPKETPSCLIPRLLVVFTRQLEILVTTLQMCHSLTLRQRRSVLQLRPVLTARYENNIVHCCRRASELCIRLCILVREPWKFIIIIIIIIIITIIIFIEKIWDSMGFEPITDHCISTAVLDQWSYEYPHIKSRMICWVHFNSFIN